MGPTGTTRIVQIHPTRRCNLSCKHCYSSSSPQATDELNATLLKDAIDDLAKEGYNWVSFSGGEPMVYEPLPEVLTHARQSGLNTTFVTNGMLLTGKRLDDIETRINALVVSLDGKPESHNRMRNSPRAFQTMQKNLSALRSRGINFGILFTLTQHNLDELPWVANFCAESDASALIVHPLEIAGNAKQLLPGTSPDSKESAHAWILLEKLKVKYEGRLNIQLDMIHTSSLVQHPDQFFLGDYKVPLQGSLSDMLAGLVIEPDGEVVPLQYGFPREFSLGNLYDKRICEMVHEWRTTLGPKLHELSSGLFRSLEIESGCRFINWYEQIDRYARQQYPSAMRESEIVWKPAVEGVA